MFELAGLSAFLDIFQKAFGLLEKRKDQKHRVFEEIVDPIYTQLSVVVDGYYGFFRSLRTDLSQSEWQHWPTVLDETKKKREEIVLARNKVIGLANPFIREQGGSKEDELLKNFGKSINLFFRASDVHVSTEAGGLFEVIESYVTRGNESCRSEVIDAVETSLRHLEMRWTKVSEAYGELRIFYLT